MVEVKHLTAPRINRASNKTLLNQWPMRIDMPVAGAWRTASERAAGRGRSIHPPRRTGETCCCVPGGWVTLMGGERFKIKHPHRAGVAADTEYLFKDIDRKAWK
jgi:hypothetical protein